MSFKKRKNKFSSFKLLTVALVVSLLAVQLPAYRAHADEAASSIASGIGEAGAVIFLAVIDSVVVINGFASGIGNLTYAVRGKKATTAWRVYSYTSSAINLVLGGLIMIKTYNNPEYPDNVAFTFGACQAGLGAAGLGVTIWSNNLDDGTEQRLSVSPMVIPDKEGGVAVGAGLKLAGW